MDGQTDWSFSVLRAQGLHHIRKEKAWRPIISVSVDCTEGRENHCPTYETVLGIDGQNPNQKESFSLTKALSPGSRLNVEVLYRSPSKKKAKKRVTVASCSCTVGELVTMQLKDQKPLLRLNPSSSSKSKSKKPSLNRSPNSAGSSKSITPHATMLLRLSTPPDLGSKKEWRPVLRGLSLDLCNAESDQEGFEENMAMVESPTSTVPSSAFPTPVSPASSSRWPASPSSSQHETDPLLPLDPGPSPPLDQDSHTGQSNVVRRRRRRRPVFKGFSLESDCEDVAEEWISESCSGSCSETQDAGYHSPTPSHHGCDDQENEEVEHMSSQSPSQSSKQQSHGWYVEIIRFTSDFLSPMMDPGFLPSNYTRDGRVDAKDFAEDSEVDTASMYSDEEELELDIGDTLTIDDESTIVGSGQGSLRSFRSETSGGSGSGKSQKGKARSGGAFSKLKAKKRREGLMTKSRSRRGSIASRKEEGKVEWETWWERSLCEFTSYGEMTKAGRLCQLIPPKSKSDSTTDGKEGDVEGGVVIQDYDFSDDEAEREEEGRRRFEQVSHRLHQEWTFMGGLLVASAAIDTAVFAIGTDGVFKIPPEALPFVAVSSVLTALGIVCDAWFLLRYAWSDIDTFVTRSRDLYQTYVFFCLSSRIPALCFWLSAIALLGFIAVVAYSSSPTAVVVICFIVGILMGLQFVVKGVEIVARCIGLVVRGVGRGVMRVVAYPVGLVKGWAGTTTGEGAGGSAGADTAKTVTTRGAAAPVAGAPPPRPPRNARPPPAAPSAGKKEKVNQAAVGAKSRDAAWRDRLKAQLKADSSRRV